MIENEIAKFENPLSRRLQLLHVAEAAEQARVVGFRSAGRLRVAHGSPSPAAKRSKSARPSSQTPMLDARLMCPRSPTLASAAPQALAALRADAKLAYGSLVLATTSAGSGGGPSVAAAKPTADSGKFWPAHVGDRRPGRSL